MVADEEAVEKDDLIIIRLAMIMRVTNVLENAWWKYIRIRISIIRINPAMIDQFSVWQLLLSKDIGVLPLAVEKYIQVYIIICSC
ncbi:hypothetical protein [Methanomethylovorans hollandica]|jgi:hypothetical protein|uniref:hypothetical protein n=1 Tax=Methanomethylovorans hollandica TaxID=101192 RepID=UPI00066246DE|nr:hypothetical protein [Methanomethylovorans hollandica]